MIVIISPSWLVQVNAEAGKYLRAKAETAVQQSKRRKLQIIPVLVGGAQMPAAEQLPEQLRSLTQRNAKPIRPDSFDYDMGLVRKALGIGSGIAPGLVAAISLIVLAALGLGVLSQTPSGNPV
jgi:hypothetical protein